MFVYIPITKPDEGVDQFMYCVCYIILKVPPRFPKVFIYIYYIYTSCNI